MKCEGKRKDERMKRETIGHGRIAVGDACKDAIVFFIPPSYAKPTQQWNVWLSKLSNQNHATFFMTKSVGTNALSYFLFLLFCARKLILNLKTVGRWEKREEAGPKRKQL